MRIAVIGTGISGLGAAYLLQHGHDVTLYEKNKTPGGHSRTIDVLQDDTHLAVDTGFIVYNVENYPHLTGLFRHLGVAVQKSDMSFGASIADGYLEYGSKGMFAQKKNLFRPRFWGMLRDILLFNARAEKHALSNAGMTLGDLLDSMKMGDWFCRYYMQAMGAAIWSCSVDTIRAFPAETFIRFFKNHGLLTVNNHPQWYTVTGGSRCYIEKIMSDFKGHIRLDCGVESVARVAEGVEVTDKHGEKVIYDHVVMAAHADETLGMLKNPTPAEQSVLGAFKFQSNAVVVHTDESFMPRHRAAWASWTYLSETYADKGQSLSLTYWMNNLQNLPTAQPVLVTLNPGRAPDPQKVLDRHHFSHPVFDRAAIEAQVRVPDIQGVSGISYCGAWQRYGFHEDGLASAVAVAKNLGADIPWM